MPSFSTKIWTTVLTMIRLCEISRHTASVGIKSLLTWITAAESLTSDFLRHPWLFFVPGVWLLGSYSTYWDNCRAAQLSLYKSTEGLCCHFIGWKKSQGLMKTLTNPTGHMLNCIGSKVYQVDALGIETTLLNNLILIKASPFSSSMSLVILWLPVYLNDPSVYNYNVCKMYAMYVTPWWLCNSCIKQRLVWRS